GDPRSEAHIPSDGTIVDHVLFGVHRFEPGVSAPIRTQYEAAQITSADLAQYLQEMGIETEFLTVMAKFREITYLPISILKKLKIFSVKDTNWQLLVTDRAFVLEATVGYFPDAVEVVIDLVCEPDPRGSTKRLVARVALDEFNY